MTKSGLGFCMALAAGLMMPAVTASAQGYPSKPIRIVVGFVPGGAVDFTARLVGQKLSERFGQPVVIENRPGAATSISAERVARAPADGYTLLLLPISTVVQSALRRNLPYDIKRDLAPVTQLAIGPFVLVVHPSLPARSVKELIELARSKPGQLEYGSPGLGGANHLATEWFNLQAKIKMLHVPYKGSAEAMIAAATGQAPITISSLAGALPLLQGKRVRALGVTTSERVAVLPEVPTIAEAALPGFEYVAWYGMGAPSGVPKEIMSQISGELARIMHLPDVTEQLGRRGMVPRTGTAEEFARAIDSTLDQTHHLVKVTGLNIN